MTKDKLKEHGNMICEESTARDRHDRRKNRLKLVSILMVVLEAVLLVIMKLGFGLGIIESIIVLTVLFLMIVTPLYLDYIGVPIHGHRGMDKISREGDELLEEAFEPLCNTQRPSCRELVGRVVETVSPIASPLQSDAAEPSTICRKEHREQRHDSPDSHQQ